MSRSADNSEEAALAVRQWLLSHYGDQLSEGEVHGLTRAIVIYIRRSTLALDEAVPRISAHFMAHGQMVHQLLADPDSQIWEVVLSKVVRFATEHPYYPAPEEASAWPDLDAYEDIRRNLPSYNFEGPLDRWISVTVVRRLIRFWRDQQALKMGGPGFRTRAVAEASDRPASARVQHISIDSEPEEGLDLSERLPAPEPSVGDQVEMAELERIVTQAVQRYADTKDDPQLPELWRALVEQNYKLREVAEKFGLSIGQVHHRYQKLREHLGANPQISRWFDSRR